jgi:hypothetical protein
MTQPTPRGPSAVRSVRAWRPRGSPVCPVWSCPLGSVRVGVLDRSVSVRGCGWMHIGRRRPSGGLYFQQGGRVPRGVTSSGPQVQAPNELDERRTGISRTQSRCRLRELRLAVRVSDGGIITLWSRCCCAARCVAPALRCHPKLLRHSPLTAKPSWSTHWRPRWRLLACSPSRATRSRSSENARRTMCDGRPPLACSTPSTAAPSSTTPFL